MMFTPFSTQSFYGITSKTKTTTTKCRNDGENNAKKMRLKYPTEFTPRILGPTVCWKTFYRQADAFAFAHSTGEDVHVFAFESIRDPTNPGTGQRRYLASSLPVFWHYYSQLQPCHRLHYEIIAENSPCKLYFDLEYQIDCNPNKDGNAMVDFLIKYVCAWIFHIFELNCNRNDVLDLDASTSSKFSRHLIFQTPGLTFENNITQGNFVHYIFGVLNKQLERADSYDNQDTHQRSPISTGSSLEKQSSLIDDLCSSSSDVPLTSCQCGQKEEILQHGHSSSKLLHSSDVSRSPTGDVLSSQGKEDNKKDCLSCDCMKKSRTVSIDETSKTKRERFILQNKDVFNPEELLSLVVNKKDGTKIFFCDLGVYTKNRNFRLYQSSKLNKCNHLKVADQNQFTVSCCNKADEDRDIFYASLVTNVSPSTERQPELLRFDSVSGPGKVGISKNGQGGMRNKGNNSSFLCHEDMATLEGWGSSSPYPEIDQYISFLILSSSQSDRHGSIRHWRYWSSKQTLVYDIVGYRWCHNIQRQHKSNNIMYVVDIGRGVFYQKCHDPDCQSVNYRSPEMTLPSNVLPGFLLDCDDFQESLNSSNRSPDVCDVSGKENGLKEGEEYEEEILLTALEDVEILQTVKGLGM